MSLIDIENKVREKVNVTFTKAIDLRGGDHIQLIVVSKEFENKTLVEQHKLIYDIFSQEMQSNVIHALTLKTYTPSQWEKVNPAFDLKIGHDI